MLWKCMGASSKTFPNIIKTLNSMHNLDLITIVEPRNSGMKAIRIINELHFTNFFVENAKWYASGICILCNDPATPVQIIHNASQAVTRVIESLGKI